MVRNLQISLMNSEVLQTREKHNSRSRLQVSAAQWLYNGWKRVNSKQCAGVSLYIEGNVKVQDTLFTAGSSGNWNVSFFSIALQLSLDLVGTKHAMNYLTLKTFILWSTHVKRSSFFKLYFRHIYDQ